MDCLFILNDLLIGVPGGQTVKFDSYFLSEGILEAFLIEFGSAELSE